MRETTRRRFALTAGATALALATVLLAGAAQAGTKYLNDGAMAGLNGGWVLPDKGTCYPAEGNGIATRPECVATMFSAYADSASCVTAKGSWSSTANVCVDNVNNTQAACVPGNGIDRKWSNGVCLLTMKGQNRNKVTCANQGGTYGPLNVVIPSLSGGACFGVWTMPDAGTFTPPLLNKIGANPSTGDQCLRCHRSDTQWNSTRIRDVESMVMTGHKNMSRKVTPNYALSGPSGAAYPADSSGNAFNWVSGTVNTGWSCTLAGTALPYPDKTACQNAGGTWTDGTDKQAYWVYDGWFEDPHQPAVMYNAPYNATTGKPGLSYSCARCHTTGWTSDAYPAGGNFPTGYQAKEPEASFAGITWDGVTLNQNGKINLAGGVTGDTNTGGSWDLFGITCTRCHGSAVNVTSPTGPLPFSAPTGMSSHNNGFTGTGGSGYCSLPNYTASAQCTAAGGTWLTTACSDGTSTTQAACVTAGKTWTFPTCSTNSLTSTAGTVPVNGLAVPQAYCSEPSAAASYGTSAACIAVAGGVWTDITSTYGSGACQTAGFTWDGTASKCYTCYVPNGKTASACAAQNVSPLSTTWTNAYASDVYSCIDAGGKWTDSRTQRGQIITSVCMNCHRQETGGYPYGTTVTGGVPSYSATDPAGQIKVGPYHNTITYPSHFHGNQYLNSPHAKFSSTFDKIATGKLYQEFGSYFIADGEAANTGNGCTGCHDVHKSTDKQANPGGGAVKECTECHSKSTSLIQHPSGIGTPLENPAESCAVCHMPGGQHFFRINTSASYSPFPSSVFTNGVTGAVQNAATSADGTYSRAVWVDLNAACGQCHGGGTSHAVTTGSITAGTTALTVADATGFASGEAVTIAGASSLAGRAADFPTFVSSVAGNVVTLVGKATFTVANARVELNPTANGAAYFSKSLLSSYAAGMHNDKPTATFNWTYGATGQDIVVDASTSKCSGSNANCNAFTWSWGDGTSNSSGVTASHHYGAASVGNVTITLTVAQYSVGDASVSQRVTIAAADARPVASGACSVDYTTWTASCTNASTDDNGVKQIVIDWGDGTLITNVTGNPPAAGPYTHTFLVPGAYTIKIKAFDAAGQFATQPLATTTASSFLYYSISGKVFQTGGTLGMGAATVQIRKSGTLVKSTMTAADGSYTTGTMKPGTYTLTVSKAGYTFTPASVDVTIGPSAANKNFTAN